MFSRGNWAIFGINPDSLAAFQANLQNERLLLELSQFTANAITCATQILSVGVNPYDRPRADEKAVVVSNEVYERVARAASNGFEGDSFEETASLYGGDLSAYMGTSEREFLIDAHVPAYAFWFVLNEWKDTSHAASFKEGKAYEAAYRPYKFLTTNEKKSLDQQAAVAQVPLRNQFPVILDFQTGRVFAESTNKNALLLLKDLIKKLGVETIQVGWRFTDTPWISPVLDSLFSNSRYSEHFKEAADERTRFNKSEVEKDEDPEISRLVHDFFSMTELETESWVGLKTPSAIQLYASSDPVVVASPTSATLLFDISRKPVIRSASLVFQQRRIRTSKDGTETAYRVDDFTIDLNDNINNTEIGVAFLRGFDMPQFKRTINKEIKESGISPEIKYFWTHWLIGMNRAVREVTYMITSLLDLERHGRFGIQPLFVKKQAEDGLSLRDKVADAAGELSNTVITAAGEGLRKMFADPGGPIVSSTLASDDTCSVTIEAYDAVIE